MQLLTLPVKSLIKSARIAVLSVYTVFSAIFGDYLVKILYLSFCRDIKCMT